MAIALIKRETHRSLQQIKSTTEFQQAMINVASWDVYPFSPLENISTSDRPQRSGSPLGARWCQVAGKFGPAVGKSMHSRAQIIKTKIGKHLVRALWNDDIQVGLISLTADAN